MPLPDEWKWKQDDSGARAFVNDDPVAIKPDGSEVVVDYAGLSGSLSSANSEAADRRRALKEAQEQLSGFEGIEPDKYTEAVKAQRKLKSLLESTDGKPEEIAAQLAETTATLATVEAERDSFRGKYETQTAQNLRLAVGSAFKSDPHFTASNGSKALTLMAPEIGQQMLGAYCKPDADGVVRVYRDTDHSEVIRDENGQPAKFDEGIQKLGSTFDWWKGQQRPKGGTGSNMEDGSGNPLQGKTIKSKADLGDFKMKQAFIEEHGHPAYRDLPATSG